MEVRFNQGIPRCQATVEGNVTPDLLIWHLDGSVIDTSQSLPSAIRRTVQNYFSLFLNVQGAGSFIQLEDVQRFQLAGGFHDPIDLTAALIRYLLSLLPGQFPAHREPRGIGEAISFLRRAGQALSPQAADELLARANLADTAEAVRKAGGGRMGMAKVVRGGWAHPLLMDEGEANLVRQLYREIYLGRKLFAQLERGQPRFHRGSGQVENEALLLDIGSFERLHSHFRGRMALVTNRTLAEAQVVLGQHRIERLFDTVVSQEEIIGEEARLRRRGQPESLQPPHPYTLVEAADRLDPTQTKQAIGIGDRPDQIRAAARAATEGGRPFVGWGVVTPSPDPAMLKASLQAAGATQIWNSANDLMRHLLDEEGSQ